MTKKVICIDNSSVENYLQKDSVYSVREELSGAFALEGLSYLFLKGRFKDYEEKKEYVIGQINRHDCLILEQFNKKLPRSTYTLEEARQAVQDWQGRRDKSEHGINNPLVILKIEEIYDVKSEAKTITKMVEVTETVTQTKLVKRDG